MSLKNWWETRTKTEQIAYVTHKSFTQLYNQSTFVGIMFLYIGTL